MENQLPDFLQELASGAAGSGRFSRDVKVINCANFDNHGEYYVIPFSDPKYGSPIRQLNRVFEIPKVVTGVKQDGSTYTRTITYRFFLNPVYYGNIDGANLTRYERIKSKANFLLEKGWKGAIVRDYTLIQGFIIQSKNKDGKVTHEKTVSLMIVRSKNFTKQLNAAFVSQNSRLGGAEWINQLCNNDLQRKRFMNCNISFVQGQGGYSCTVSFGKFDEDMYQYTGGKDYYDLEPYKEVLDQLGNPVNKFLDMPVDIPLWDDKYLDELEGHINACIRSAENGGAEGQGEMPDGVVNPDVVKSPETISEPAPTNMTPKPVPEPEPVKAPDDDLPF